MSDTLMNDWLYFFGFLGLIGFLLLMADLLLKKLEVNAHTTRRIVHILVGIYVSSSPFIFASKMPVLTLAFLFVIINYFGVKYKLLPGIHSTSRLTYGTVYFPLSFFILVMWFWEKDPAILIVSMLIMAFGDPIASWVGESRKNPRSYRVWSDSKSVQGSLAMFITAYLVSVGGMYFFRIAFGGDAFFLQIAFYSYFVAAYATMSETVSHEGTDNLTVPLGAGLMLDFMFHSEAAMVHQLMLWMVITTAIAWLAYRMKTLSLSGAVGA
jgi:phytol kinase